MPLHLLKYSNFNLITLGHFALWDGLLILANCSLLAFTRYKSKLKIVLSYLDIKNYCEQVLDHKLVLCYNLF